MILKWARIRRGGKRYLFRADINAHTATVSRSKDGWVGRVHFTGFGVRSITPYQSAPCRNSKECRLALETYLLLQGVIQ